VNDETISSILNDIESPNQGLVGSAADFGLSGSISKNLPPIVKPVFQVPLKQDVNYANDPTAALGIPDPNLRTPYVQAWTFGLQHEVKNTIFELRYVANHAVKAFRAFDYNQVIIKQNGFLNEFLKAQSNGNLALAAIGNFDPRYNPAIKGSQPLPIFDQIAAPDLGLTRGGLTNSFIKGLIQTGEPAELATQYQINGFTSPIAFFTNPVALGTDTITNFSNSTYNSLQFEARRRVSSRLNSKGIIPLQVLTDAGWRHTSRFQPFRSGNTKIERSRPFDIRHAIKANSITICRSADTGSRSRILNLLISVGV
jgi:hypothetical protein